MYSVNVASIKVYSSERPWTKKKKTYFSINITFFIPENEIFNSVKVFLKFYLYIYLLKKVWGQQVLRSAITGGEAVY